MSMFSACFKDENDLYINSGTALYSFTQGRRGEVNWREGRGELV
jgi:hypothetical protein